MRLWRSAPDGICAALGAVFNVDGRCDGAITRPKIAAAALAGASGCREMAGRPRPGKEKAWGEGFASPRDGLGSRQSGCGPEVQAYRCRQESLAKCAWPKLTGREQHRALAALGAGCCAAPS